MGNTRKVGSTGRFGPRYGLKIRKNALSIERLKNTEKCPNCFKPSIRRQSPGIWACKKCGLKMAGRAYQLG